MRCMDCSGISGSPACDRTHSDMGKTYKDRDRVGRPRVPEWARPKPTRIHKDKKKEPEDRDDYLQQLWESDHEE